MPSPVQDSSQPSRNPAPEFLIGVVERITYHAEKSGYTVARIKSPKARDLITIVGNFADIQAGQTLQLNGTWKNNPQYGQQFEVQQYTIN